VAFICEYLRRPVTNGNSYPDRTLCDDVTALAVGAAMTHFRCARHPHPDHCSPVQWAGSVVGHVGFCHRLLIGRFLVAVVTVVRHRRLRFPQISLTTNHIEHTIYTRGDTDFILYAVHRSRHLVGTSVHLQRFVVNSWMLANCCVWITQWQKYTVSE